MTPGEFERFEAKVQPEPNSGCWLWSGACSNGGYGRFKIEGDMLKLAHRLSYEHFVGPIADGLCIDHLCRVRSCVNPSHLEAVTLRENLLRGEGPSARCARQTHCLRGHEFTEENTYCRRNARKRECRTCRNMHSANWKKREKEKTK